MQEAKIKQMQVEDLDCILEIERASFPSPWPKKLFLRDLSNNSLSLYFNIILEEIVGFIGCWIIIDELHIINLAIRPGYRQRGFADKLLRFIFSKAKSLGLIRATLEVRVSNEKAIRLYKKHGFYIAKTMNNYYDNKEDALIMWKEFNND